MDIERLRAVAMALEARGVEVDGLRSLETEAVAIERPPGLLGSLKAKVAGTVLSQWRNVRGEVGETSEAFSLLARRVTSKEPLEPEEADKIKAQLMDFVKVVPAGVFAAANAALPIPGTSVFTPMVLSKMGLMPSRWKEAHLLHTLRSESDRLRAAGHGGEADELDALRAEVEADADAREEAAKNASLLTHWDENDNGVWDDDERAAYRSELDKLRHRLFDAGAKKRWFLRIGPEVWGPVRLSEIIDDADELDNELLVCFDGSSGWVDLQDLSTGRSQI